MHTYISEGFRAPLPSRVAAPANAIEQRVCQECSAPVRRLLIVFATMYAHITGPYFFQGPDSDSPSMEKEKVRLKSYNGMRCVK